MHSPPFLIPPSAKKIECNDSCSQCSASNYFLRSKIHVFSLSSNAENAEEILYDLKNTLKEWRKWLIYIYIYIQLHRTRLLDEEKKEASCPPLDGVIKDRQRGNFFQRLIVRSRFEAHVFPEKGPRGGHSYRVVRRRFFGETLPSCRDGIIENWWGSESKRDEREERRERGDIFAQHTFRDIVLQPRWPLCDQPFRGSFNREREGFTFRNFF